jgi:hypothetical protein
VGRQRRGAAELRQLDQEQAAGDLRAGRLDQTAERARGPAGREQVVVHQHAVPWADGVRVQLECVAAVFERVLGADRALRQLAGLAREHEATAKLARDRGPQQEAARLGADHDVGRPHPRELCQRRNRGVERLTVGEQRRDVAKADPRLGEVRDLAHERAQARVEWPDALAHGRAPLTRAACAGRARAAGA